MMNDWRELQAGSRAADDAWPQTPDELHSFNTPTPVVSLDIYVVLFYFFGFLGDFEISEGVPRREVYLDTVCCARTPRKQP